MNTELKVLEIVTQKLEKAGMGYMITGSIAMNYYATPRMTRDLDLVIELNKSDIPKLLSLFQKEFYIDEQMILEALKHEGLFNIIHNDWVIKVDFIIRKTTPYRKLEFSRRKKVKLEGFSFWIVSPEDLIISKLSWAKESMSDFQLRDVQNLLEGVENLDLKYIEKWVKDLALDKPYQKIKS
ncbi:MAG: nucleotidyltransferase [Deltaproteobacteria bacterium]|nr:nucleotidyltransferase [Deltaproteobacteria bacterium]